MRIPYSRSTSHGSHTHPCNRTRTSLRTRSRAGPAEALSVLHASSQAVQGGLRLGGGCRPPHQPGRTARRARGRGSRAAENWLQALRVGNLTTASWAYWTRCPPSHRRRAFRGTNNVITARPTAFILPLKTWTVSHAANAAGLEAVGLPAVPGSTARRRCSFSAALDPETGPFAALTSIRPQCCRIAKCSGWTNRVLPLILPSRR